MILARSEGNAGPIVGPIRQDSATGSGGETERGGRQSGPATRHTATRMPDTDRF
jgi:hypothetical protein